MSCELDNFIFKVLYWVILHWYYIKGKWNYNTSTGPFEKSKIVFFASLVMKNTVMTSSQVSFPVKLFCCIAFQWESSIIYWNLLVPTYSILWNKDNLVDNQLCAIFSNDNTKSVFASWKPVSINPFKY